MHTTPQKRLFQPPSEILVHRGVCILNGMALRTGPGKPGKSWNFNIPKSRPGNPGKSILVMESHGKSWKIEILHNINKVF